MPLAEAQDLICPAAGSGAMKMTKFRVQHYKKIEDTEWVSVGQMTAFVGKNESGKSAIFKGLSKLNPSDGEKYVGLKEFPRKRFTNEFEQQSWPVSSAAFELMDDEAEHLKNISESLGGIESVTATRGYDDKLQIEYTPAVKRFDLKGVEFASTLNAWKDSVERLTNSEHAEDLPSFKQGLCAIIDETIQNVKNMDQVTQGVVSNMQSRVNTTISAEWQTSLTKNITDELESLVSKFEINTALDQADQFVKDNLPIFVYFDRYDIIDSALKIDDLAKKIESDPHDPRIRITKCLFTHVNLDIKQINTLNPSATDDPELAKRQADERNIRLTSAANAMTDAFSKWWHQGKHKFHYQIDNHWFRVWVSDNLDASGIELDQRSAGMQYFFSFFLVFLTEAKEKHRNSILLLDEPGLHYHGTAQKETVRFLRRLSDENQVLYTTHSPFMLDADHLESIRIVFEDEAHHGSTRVSSNVRWPKDKDALFPLQAGLGYSMAQTLFYSKMQVVVEGITDYMYIKAVSSRLRALSRTGLLEDIAVVPAGGTKNIARLASLLRGNDVRAITLLDGDEAGIQAKRNSKRLLADILVLDDYTEKNKSEIEDMFGEELVMKAVKKVHPNIDLTFTPDEQNIASSIDKVHKLFKRGGKELDKYEVCRVIMEWINVENGDRELCGKALDRFEKLFEQCNALLKQQQP